jgi:hypothetical protein
MAAPLRRFPWLLWALLSALWIGFWLAVFGLAGISVYADTLYWMIVVAPPVGVLVGTLTLSRVAAFLRERQS